jgi:hypothetical protein
MSTMTITTHERVVYDTATFERTDIETRRRLSNKTKAMILVDVEAPHKILACNEEWRRLCGFGEDAIGQPPSILQGEMTDMKKAALFRRELVGSGKAIVTLANYHKNGTVRSCNAMPHVHAPCSNIATAMSSHTLSTLSTYLAGVRSSDPWRVHQVREWRTVLSDRG